MLLSKHASLTRTEQRRAPDGEEDAYFTYRPLSNLPTPPPSYKDVAHTPAQLSCGDTKLNDRYRSPAIHLANLIPSCASLATPSVSLVQALLTRAELPLETVALAVCILDSLDAKFGRTWRVSCPVRPTILTKSFTPTSSKRHTLPPAPLLHPQQQAQGHIDSVSPELIVLAALTIAVKFIEDPPQQQTRFYCEVWGRSLWSSEQLNVTERCIMKHLNYRIMPLYQEDCLADAMVDMQLAGQQTISERREPTPPDSTSGIDDSRVVGHARSKTMDLLGGANRSSSS